MSFLAGLNDAQCRAVDHHEGPLGKEVLGRHRQEGLLVGRPELRGVSNAHFLLDFLVPV